MNSTSGDNKKTLVYTKEQDIIFYDKRVKASTEAPPPYEKAITETSLDNDNTFIYPVPSNLYSFSSAARPLQTLPMSVAFIEDVYIWYFWDIENIPLLKRYTPIEIHNIVDAIRSLCGDFFAGAKINHMNFRVVTASENVVPRNIKDALVRKTVEFHDRPYNGQPERADKDILRLMFDTVLDNFEKKNMAFVLITGDGGYMDFLESLKKKGVIPILIHKDNANEEIKNCAKHLLHWNQVLTRAKISLKETDASAPEIKQSHTPLNVSSSQPLEDVGNVKTKKGTKDRTPKLNVPSNSPLQNSKDVSNMNGKKQIGGQTPKVNTPSNDPSVQKPKDVSNMNDKKVINVQTPKEVNTSIQKPKDVSNMSGKKEINVQTPKVNTPSNSPLVQKPKDVGNMNSKKPYITVLSLSFSVTDDMLMRWFPKAISCEFTTENNIRNVYIRFNHEKDAMEWWGKSLVYEGFKINIKKEDKSLDFGKPIERPAVNTPIINLPKKKKPYIVILSLSSSVTKDMLMRWFPKAISCEFAAENNRRTAYIRFNHENDAMEWWGKSPVFEGFRLDIKKMDKQSDVGKSIVGKSIEQPAVNVFFTVSLSNERSQKAYGVSEAIFQYMEKHFEQIEKITMDGQDHMILYQPINVKKFVFEGPSAEISQVVDKIKRFIHSLEEVHVPRKHPFNEFAANLFTTYNLQKLEHEWNVSLSIIPSRDDRALDYKTYDVIIVGPKGEPGARQTSAIVQALNLLGPVVIKLDLDQLQRLETPHDKGSSQLDIIADKHTVTYNIVDRGSGREIVLYAFAAPNLASAKEAIEQTLVTKRSISFWNGILAHAIKFHAAEIDTIRLRNNSVIIVYPWPIPLKEQQLKQIAEAPNGMATISFSGPLKKVTNVNASFKKLMDGMSLVSETFKYPHSRRFQARRRFENIKKTIEMEENVSIFLQFKENTSMDTNSGNLRASRGAKDKGSSGKQFSILMITVTVVGTRSAAKDILARFDGIRFDSKYIITAEELNKNGLQLQPLIKALNPPKNKESTLRDYLHNKLNVGFYLIPSADPNRIELFGENEEVVLAATQKIISFLV